MSEITPSESAIATEVRKLREAIVIIAWSVFGWMFAARCFDATEAQPPQPSVTVPAEVR